MHDGCELEVEIIFCSNNEWMVDYFQCCLLMKPFAYSKILVITQHSKSSLRNMWDFLDEQKLHNYM